MVREFSDADKIINRYDFSISHTFIDFFQKFLPVTICHIQSTDATLAKCVRTEQWWILAPAVTCHVTEGTDVMDMVSSHVTTMDLGSPLRSLTVEVSDNITI